MKIRLLLALVPALFFTAPLSAQPDTNSDTGWRLQKEQSGIRIYTRPDPESPLDEFKGVVELDTRLSSLVKLIRDAHRTTEWMHRSGGTRVIETVSWYEQILHTITLSPWPISNRDVILRATLRQDPETLVITIELQSLESHSRHQSGYVRMPRLEGKWIFKPLNTGLIQVSYQMSADPGGTIPGWLAGNSSIDMPYVTLKNMREILREAIYATATVEGVIEP